MNKIGKANKAVDIIEPEMVMMMFAHLLRLNGHNPADANGGEKLGEASDLTKKQNQSALSLQQMPNCL